ncbi:MAG: hypothetical protein E6G45_07710, partial [Actinobacteria bacterium]
MRMRLRFRSLGLALLSVAAAGVLLQIGPAQASSKKARRSTASATKQQALADYGKLPLSFTANAGQADARVRYAAQGAGFSVFLTRREAMLSFQRPGKQRKGRGVALALRFLGSNRNVAIRGERPGPARVNYLLGNDPAKWHTGLRTYERVVYRNLWPRVDMVLAGQNGELKYEFLLRPGARVDDIRLAYRGAKGLSLDRQGNLRIGTSLGGLTDTRPASYQLVAGKRVPVRSSFALDRRGTGYGFALGRGYDRRYPLVIDPRLAYSSYLGGVYEENGNSIAVDGAGNAYVTGYTGSENFPTTAGAFDTTYNGGFSDAFVTKLDASGAALVYSTYLGGSGPSDSGNDWGSGIAVDGAGSAYVTGYTSSVDFPTTAGAFDTTYNGNDDVFVTKLDASGAALGYSTYLGASGDDRSTGIALDGAGSAYVTGFTGSGFPTTAGAFDTTYNGNGDDFVTKFDTSGAALVYSTYLGGSEHDVGYGIAVDGAGSAYLTGATTSPDFPTTAGAFDTTPNGGDDAFATKFDASGAALGYSSYLGGSGGDGGNGIALDGAGSAYLTGFTGSANFPTTAGAFDTTYNGGGDAFATKFDASGAVLGYSGYLGGSAGDNSIDIALDGAGSAYLTGFTTSPNFPTTADALDTTLDGGIDASVTKFDASGADLVYSSYLGGTNADYGFGIAVDGAGDAYLTGYTSASDFPTTAGAFDTTYNGNDDAYVTKLDLAAPPPPPPPPPPPSCLSTKILIAYADNGHEPEMIRNALLAEPGVTAVDLFDGSNGIPTLNRLREYKIVVAFGGAGWLNPTAVGDVLADYMDAGGVVVATTFVWDIRTAELRGRYMTGGYTPFNTTNAEAFTWATLGDYDADHPVMAGVTMLSALGRNDLTLALGADLIASWSDGVLAIATK